jgi:phospholipase D1/2
VQQQSGVLYEDARRQHDDIVGAGFGGYGEGTQASSIVAGLQYQQYQQAAMKPGVAGGERWDSVCECYMLNGTDIRSVPWDGDPEAEIDAFVSEELYIHSKVRVSV